VLKHVTADYIHTQLAFSDCQRELAESKRAAADAVRRLGEWAATTGRPIQELDAAAEVARLTKERDTLASQLCEAHGKLGEITSGYRDAHRELADCHRKHADAMRRISEFERVSLHCCMVLRVLRNRFQDRQTQRLEASIIQDLEAAAVGRDAELTRTKEELARTKTQLSDANDMLLLKNDHLERNKVRFGELRQEICSLQPGQVAKRIADIEKALSESQKLVATLQASEVVKRLAESEQNLADCRDLIETFRADDVVKRLDESSKKLADIQKSLSGSPNDVHRRVVEQTLTLRANELRIETLTAEVKRLSKYEAQARALQADAVAKRLAECEELVRSLRADNSSLSERLAIKWPGTALLPPTRAEYTALLEEKAQVKGFHIRDVCGLADEAFILQMGQALMDLKLQNDKVSVLSRNVGLCLTCPYAAGVAGGRGSRSHVGQGGHERGDKALLLWWYCGLGARPEAPVRLGGVHEARPEARWWSLKTYV
jgi:hypothetical protein